MDRYPIARRQCGKQARYMLPVRVIGPGHEGQVICMRAGRGHNPKAIVDLMHRAKALVRGRMREPAALAVVKACQHRRAGRCGPMAAASTSSPTA